MNPVNDKHIYAEIVLAVIIALVAVWMVGCTEREKDMHAFTVHNGFYDYQKFTKENL